MPANLTTLQGRRDALKTALASGTKSVSYGDYRKEFVSIADMMTAIKDIEQDIAALGGGPAITRTYRLTSHKDL
jgi:hypothetical protein